MPRKPKKPSMKDVVTIWCYNQKSTMTRGNAIDKYMKGMLACEGSESTRYMNIFSKLRQGYTECDDSNNWDGPRNVRRN